MILVVEGISASGKSSWCAEHAPRNTIAETGRLNGVPDRISDPVGAASFWAERNVVRWQGALAVENERSYAVCDTDPLKLHYIWCLWQVGEAPERDWLLELAATRQTVANGRIGFADQYIVANVEQEVARARGLADVNQRRRNLDLHVRLKSPLLDWYAALDSALPGRVQIGFPSKISFVESHDNRYDLLAFDAMIEALPKYVRSIQ
jgi:hypothetical protein